MESDHDYQSFSPLEEKSSPPIHHRRLKRLKKAVNIPPSESSTKSDIGLLGLPRVLEALEAGKTLGFDDSSEPMQSQPSQNLSDKNEINSDFDALRFEKEHKEIRRALEFDYEVLDRKGGDFGSEMELESLDLHAEKSEKKRINDYRKEGDHNAEMELETLNVNVKKSKKKRINDEKLNGEKGENKKKTGTSSDNDAITKARSSNRRREEKERKAYLQQLHSDSQRLLRETRDVAFKPLPVVQKPISSILEKIRQRKLEVSKKIAMPNSNSSYPEKNNFQTEATVDLHFGNLYVEERKFDVVAKEMEIEATIHRDSVEGSLNVSPNDGSKESPRELNSHNIKPQMDLHEESTYSFRVPLGDTQDLFTGFQTSDTKDELADDTRDSPLEEVLAPTIFAMNLKFGSSPSDDISSDEEDNDKENVYPHKLDNESSSKGDPAKAFLDVEALEEDNSDHDLLCFEENEDEDDEDSEGLNDMITTQYEEGPIDNERRNELHQKWLEQQDAAGTDNLLQRLKYGSKHMETTLFEEEEEEDINEDEEDFNSEDKDVSRANLARLNQRKAKQIITQMFSDKDGAFLSDDDGETERRLVKQHILVQAEEQVTLLPPAEDESSREVFGLIKKLDNVPEPRKKAKTSSFFDSVLRGQSDSSSKSSFLGRASNHPLSSSRKQGSSMLRSFIFGRDDSNSRSSISISEDSVDSIPQENHPTGSFTLKFCSSQAKTSLSPNVTAGMATGTSLFEILKQSSTDSNVCNQDRTAVLTRNMFDAFKIPKKLIKMDRKI